MKKEQKLSLMDSAKKIFAENSVVILFNYKSLNAQGISSLRKALKAKNANMRVFKNTLIKRVIADSEIKVLSTNFKDQVAVSYSNDPVALSNVLINFAKGNEAVGLKIGFMDGKILELDAIKNMSLLGSIEEVRSKFIGLLKAPCSKLVRTLSAYETKLNENAGK